MPGPKNVRSVSYNNDLRLDIDLVANASQAFNLATLLTAAGSTPLATELVIDNIADASIDPQRGVKPLEYRTSKDAGSSFGAWIPVVTGRSYTVPGIFTNLEVRRYGAVAGNATKATIKVK